MRWFNRQPKRSPLQERALEVALSIYNSDLIKYRNTMFCPYCGQPLVNSGTKRPLQTLTEHVSDPNATPSLKDVYVCSNKDEHSGNIHKILFAKVPVAAGCYYGILHCWNDDVMGERGGSYWSEVMKAVYKMTEDSTVEHKYIDEWLDADRKLEFTAALNTFECESQTDIYKVGLKSMTTLPSWITFNKIKLILDWSYKADSFGRVTKTWVKLGFLKKDRSGRFCISGSFPWHTWRFLHKKFMRKWLGYWSDHSDCKFKDKKQEDLSYLDCFRHGMNDDWIYRFHHWFITIGEKRKIRSICEEYHYPIEDYLFIKSK